MNRNTHQKDFYHSNHRKFPRWGRLAKEKDFRKVNACHTTNSCISFAEILKYKYPPFHRGRR